jgi:hypothetical protein
MDRITVRYVRFYAPGSFCANDWTVEVQSADPAAVVWPENAYAFTMNERVDAHDGPEVFKGEDKQIGPMYYHPDSKVATLREVKARNDSRDRILISNMECNRWPGVIYTRWGNWPQPYEADKMRILGATLPTQP